MRCNSIILRCVKHKIKPHSNLCLFFPVLPYFFQTSTLKETNQTTPLFQGECSEPWNTHNEISCKLFPKFFAASSCKTMTTAAAARAQGETGTLELLIEEYTDPVYLNTLKKLHMMPISMTSK